MKTLLHRVQSPAASAAGNCSRLRLRWTVLVTFLGLFALDESRAATTNFLATAPRTNNNFIAGSSTTDSNVVVVGSGIWTWTWPLGWLRTNFTVIPSNALATRITGVEAGTSGLWRSNSSSGGITNTAPVTLDYLQVFGDIDLLGVLDASSGVNLTGIPGSGSLVAIDGVGSLFRTNASTVDPITNRFATANIFTNRGQLRQEGGAKLPSLTASRALVLNSSGDITNAAGTPDGTKFLRDDGTYAVPAGGGGGGSVTTNANQFGATADGMLTIKAAARLTNESHYGEILMHPDGSLTDGGEQTFYDYLDVARAQWIMGPYNAGGDPDQFALWDSAQNFPVFYYWPGRTLANSRMVFHAKTNIFDNLPGSGSFVAISQSDGSIRKSTLAGFSESSGKLLIDTNVAVSGTNFMNSFVGVARPTDLIWGGNSRNIQGGSEVPWGSVFTNHFFPKEYLAHATNEAASGTPIEAETNRFMTNIRAQWAPGPGTNAWYFVGDPIVNVALGSNTTITIMTFSNLFRMALESNFTPVVFTGFDYGVNGASLSVAQRMELGKINSWLLTNGFRGVRVVDVARAFSSRTATSDGVHMHNWSMTNLAELVWQCMNSKQTAEPRTYAAKYTELEVVGPANIAFGGFLAPMQIQSDYPGIAYESSASGARYVPTIYNAEWTLFGSSSGGTVTGNQLYGMNESRSWFKAPFIVGDSTAPSGISLSTPGATAFASSRLTNGVFFPSNGVVSAAIVTAGITNGGYWQGVLSNAFQVAWMSNNVMNWKILAP